MFRVCAARCLPEAPPHPLGTLSCRSTEILTTWTNHAPHYTRSAIKHQAWATFGVNYSELVLRVGPLIAEPWTTARAMLHRPEYNTAQAAIQLRVVTDQAAVASSAQGLCRHCNGYTRLVPLCGDALRYSMGQSRCSAVQAAANDTCSRCNRRTGCAWVCAQCSTPVWGMQEPPTMEYLDRLVEKEQGA